LGPFPVVSKRRRAFSPAKHGGTGAIRMTAEVEMAGGIDGIVDAAG
jgi:hypothetical protein